MRRVHSVGWVLGAHGGILVQQEQAGARSGDLGGPVLGGESDLACRLYGPPVSRARRGNLCS